jgi:hypothetical protein
LQYIKYIILEFSLSIILLYTPPPILGIVSKGIFFPFTFMCIWYLHHIHTPTPFPHLLCPPSLLLSPTGKACFAFLFSYFAKERKKK